MCSARVIIDTQVLVTPHFFWGQSVAHFWVAVSNVQVQINKSRGLQQVLLSVAFTIVEGQDSEPISTQPHSLRAFLDWVDVHHRFDFHTLLPGATACGTAGPVFSDPMLPPGMDLLDCRAPPHLQGNDCVEPVLEGRIVRCASLLRPICERAAQMDALVGSGGA